MNTWVTHPLCSMDGELILIQPPCEFHICGRRINQKSDKFKYVDFGIFEKGSFDRGRSLKPNFEFDILSFLKKNDVFRIDYSKANVVLPFHTDHCSMHGIKRTLLPGRWLNLFNPISEMGIFQGFYSRRKYAFKICVNKLSQSNFILFSPIHDNFKMKDLHVIFDMLIASANVVLVHES